jgi:hypothetical protein
MTVSGIDLSSIQPLTFPWEAVRKRGFQYAIVRLSNGAEVDASGPIHSANARSNGYLTGGYGVIYHSHAVANCDTFISTFARCRPAIAMLDIETANLTYTDIKQWCERFISKSTLNLILYGNTGTLNTLLQNDPFFAQFYVMIAAYGPARPTSVPPAGTYKFPNLWLAQDAKKKFWQYAGNNGDLSPDYGKSIDLSIYYGSDLELGEAFGIPMASHSPLVLSGDKFALHSISPNKIVPLARRAHDNGLRYAFYKTVNDGSPHVEIKGIDPLATCVCRYTNPNPNYEALQGVEGWDLNARRHFAQFSIQHIFDNATAWQLAAINYFGVINEPDPKNNYNWLALAMMELVKEANRRNIHLALPALPQGTPEWIDMKRMAETMDEEGNTLFRLMKTGGHILDVHEGVFRDQPIDFGFGDIIPGAPFVAGAGSTNFRHRYLYQILEQRDEVVPLIISEFYGGGRYSDSPAEQLKRFAWYDTRARAEWYLIGFSGFTIDPDGAWLDADYTSAYMSAEFLNYQLSQRGIPNAEQGDDIVDEQLRQLVVDQANKSLAGAKASQVASQAIIDAVRASSGWWIGLVAPFPKIPVPPSPVQMRDATGAPLKNADGTPNMRQNAMDIFAVNGDLLRVTNFNSASKPDWWVKAEEVPHP